MFHLRTIIPIYMYILNATMRTMHLVYSFLSSWMLTSRLLFVISSVQKKLKALQLPAPTEQSTFISWKAVTQYLTGLHMQLAAATAAQCMEWMICCVRPAGQDICFCHIFFQWLACPFGIIGEEEREEKRQSDWLPPPPFIFHPLLSQRSKGSSSSSSYFFLGRIKLLRSTVVLLPPSVI